MSGVLFALEKLHVQKYVSLYPIVWVFLSFFQTCLNMSNVGGIDMVDF